MPGHLSEIFAFHEEIVDAVDLVFAPRPAGCCHREVVGDAQQLHSLDDRVLPDAGWAGYDDQEWNAATGRCIERAHEDVPDTESRVLQKVGYDTSAASAPSMAVSPSEIVPAIPMVMAIRWSPKLLTAVPRSLAPPRMTMPSGVSSDVDAKTGQSGDGGGYAVGLLDAQFLGVPNDRPRPPRGPPPGQAREARR